MQKLTSGADKAKAHRLRAREKSGKDLDPIDKLWLADYDEVQQRRLDERRARSKASMPEIGASRSKRTIHLDVDEEKEAAGTGPTAAAVAAGAALEAREEGRRLDSLTSGALAILQEAVGVYRDIAVTMKEQWTIMAKAVGDAMAAHRENYLAGTEAEARILQLEKQLEEKGNGVEEMMTQILASQIAARVKSPNGSTPG